MLASETSRKPSLVWQGLTKDGYTLRLTRSGLARITSKLKQTGLENLVKSNMNGSLEGAVVPSIAQVVSNATHSGTLSRPDSGHNLQVFTAVGRTRNYQILTQPLGSRQAGIISIRSLAKEISREWEQESEYEGELEQALQEGEGEYEQGSKNKGKGNFRRTARYSGAKPAPKPKKSQNKSPRRVIQNRLGKARHDQVADRHNIPNPLNNTRIWLNTLKKERVADLFRTPGGLPGHVRQIQMEVNRLVSDYRRLEGKTGTEVTAYQNALNQLRNALINSAKNARFDFNKFGITFGGLASDLYLERRSNKLIVDGNQKKPVLSRTR